MPVCKALELCQCVLRRSFNCSKTSTTEGPAWEGAKLQLWSDSVCVCVFFALNLKSVCVSASVVQKPQHMDRRRPTLGHVLHHIDCIPQLPALNVYLSVAGNSPPPSAPHLLITKQYLLRALPSENSLIPRGVIPSFPLRQLQQ